MQFFLYEIVARIVAIYLCVECYRELRNGLVERKIRMFSADFMNWILETRFWTSRSRLFKETPRRSVTGYKSASRQASWLDAWVLRYLDGGTQTPEHPATKS